MPPTCKMAPEFESWAGARLRALFHARTEDAQSGTSNNKVSAFGSLFKYYMVEYDRQPFASSTHNAYSGRGLTDTQLRKMAGTYLRNHSVASSKKLASFERNGGEAAEHPFRAAPALEMWAGANNDRILNFVRAELGIAVDAPLPLCTEAFIASRKRVLSREFNLLSEAEREEWRELARSRQSDEDREAFQPAIVQSLQDAFSDQLLATIQEKTRKGALGATFFVAYQGFYVGAHDFFVHPFCGQSTSYANATQWHETPYYKQEIQPLWLDFLSSQVEGHCAPNLMPLPNKATGSILASRRAQLKAYFETVWSLSLGDGDVDFNEERFWADVGKRPEHYVSKNCLPDGVRFANPLNLSEKEFVALYEHAQRGQLVTGKTSTESCFVYNRQAVEAAAAAGRAVALQKAQEESRAGGVRSGNTGSGVRLVRQAPIETCHYQGPATTATSSSGREHQVFTTSSASLPTSPTPSEEQTAIPVALPMAGSGTERSPGRRAVRPSKPITANMNSISGRGPVSPVQNAIRSFRPAVQPSASAAVQSHVLRMPSSSPQPPGNPVASTASVPTKRRRRNSIPLATEEEMSAMGNSLGARGYNTRNRENRRPVENTSKVRRVTGLRR